MTIQLPLPPPNLPRLLPGETLYSWCGRVHRWNGNLSVLETSRQLFGKPYAALRHDLPGNLAALVARTEGLIGDVEVLATKHTLLGYYLVHLPERRATDELARAAAGTASFQKLSLGLPASRLGASHPLKACPHCVAEDAIADEQARWRVVHQHPTALVCVKHVRPLVQFVPNPTAVHLRRWLSPSDILESSVELPVRSDSQVATLLRMSVMSENFAARAPASLDSSIMARAYQHALRDWGVTTASGSLRTGPLLSLIRRSYQECVDLPGFHVLKTLEDDRIGLLGKLARSCPRPQHPFKHLLLICALFGSWAQFLEQYSRASELRQRPEDARLSMELIEPRRAERIRFVRLVREDRLSVTTAARVSGVTPTTGVRWAKLEGLPYKSRPKAITNETLAMARALLVEGMSKHAIATKSGLSMTTLSRLLSSEPTIRKAWGDARLEQARALNRKRFVRVIDANPGLPVRLLRRIAGNGYQFLYRHDRAWLAEHLPALWSKGTRVDEVTDR